MVKWISQLSRDTVQLVTIEMSGFANNIHTHEGGTHGKVSVQPLTVLLMAYARKNKLLKDPTRII